MQNLDLKNKTVFITGVAGFIGSNLAERLLKEIEGIKIVGLDNMNDYYDVRLKEYRLEKLSSSEAFSFVKGNLADKEVVNSIFEKYKPGLVVNLGAQAGVRYSIINPDAYIEGNLVGFYNILEGCRHYPVEHLVYASSSSVYGSNKKVPYSTEDKVDKGMVGTALCNNLKNIRDGKNKTRSEIAIEEIYEYDLGSTAEELDEYCQKSDFIFNLAGVNRPENPEDFMKGNFGFASALLDCLKKHNNKATIVENYGILQEDLIKEKFTKPNHKMILFLGFICERKGCLDIPAIVDQVCRKIPDARFIIGGSGEIEKVKQKLSAKYKDNVEFPGWIRNEQKKQYLREADIFLLPSYNEGMPMAILDAMGCGLPIVSTEVGGIPKIVRQGVNGYLYKPGDSKNMACAIIEYLTDDEKRLKAGRESVDVIRKSYSLQQNIDKLERVYTEVERLRNDKL